ncbi:MAG: hypothetical protein ABWZ40_05160 [Caulobacterales bacterium]
MDKGSGGTGMRETRYLQILEAYGADPKHWPEAERVAAMEFAATGGAPDSRQEAALDAALRAYGAVQAHGADEAVMARILTQAPMRAVDNVVRLAPFRAAKRKVQTGWLAGRGMMAAGFAAAAIMGVVIGASGLADVGGAGVTTADASSEALVSYALAEG